MMQKDKNPIFPNVAKTTTWKLGLFFSLFLLLTSNSVFAFSDKFSSENVVDSFAISSADQTSETVIHIVEGAMVYGIDNFSQPLKSPSSSTSKPDKKFGKKKLKVIARKKTEALIENKISNPEITVYVSKHPSDSFFQGSNDYIKVGTITTDNTFKFVELIKTYDVVIPILYNKKFYYIYSFPFIKSITDRYSFTRPPPGI